MGPKEVLHNLGKAIIEKVSGLNRSDQTDPIMKDMMRVVGNQPLRVATSEELRTKEPLTDSVAIAVRNVYERRMRGGL